MTTPYHPTTVDLATPVGQVNGWQETLKPANIAGNAVSDLTVPGGEYWQLILATATLTTSATVANRVPGLLILDPDGTVVENRSIAAAVAASSVAALQWSAGAFTPYTDAVPSTHLPITQLFLHPSWKLRFAVAAGVAGDTLSGIVAVVQRYRIGVGGSIVGRGTQVGDGDASALVDPMTPGDYGRNANPDSGWQRTYGNPRRTDGS